MDPINLIQQSKRKLSDSKPTIERLHALGISKKSNMGYKTSQIVVTYPPVQSLEPVSGKNLFPEALHGKNTLYVNVPYCTGICTYCSYARSATSPEDKRIPEYLDLIEKESSVFRNNFGGSKIKVDSIYIGGGTPTLLSEEKLTQLLETIRRDYQFDENTEFTIEGSPETISAEKVRLSRKYGVNRVSIGVESFDDGILKSINRRHNSEGAFAALGKIREGGIENIDFDLIRGLPGYTTEMMAADVKAVERAQVPSITSYQYQIKPNSIDNRNFSGANFDEWDKVLMHLIFTTGLMNLGYTQRPIDWFIKDGAHVYRHQILKWEEMANQISLGLSSYGYIGNTQYTNFTDLKQYRESILSGRLPLQSAMALSKDEVMRRRFIFGLKTRIDRQGFADTYGADPMESSFKRTLQELISAGGIEADESAIKLTEAGSLFADWIQMAFYSDAIKQKGRNLLNVL